MIVSAISVIMPGCCVPTGASPSCGELRASLAWGHSGLVTLGLHGEVFFWEVATLIDIMLLGHWIEMKSVLGASAALENLVRLLPAEAHLVGVVGSTRNVPVSQLKRGDRVLVKPGEKVPTDGLVVRARHWSTRQC